MPSGTVDAQVKGVTTPKRRRCDSADRALLVEILTWWPAASSPQCYTTGWSSRKATAASASGVFQTNGYWIPDKVGFWVKRGNFWISRRRRQPTLI